MSVKYDALSVIKLLMKNDINVAPTSSEKEILIFIGPSQTGKSTIINAINNIPLQYQYIGLKKSIVVDLDKINSDQIYAPIGDGSVGKTEFPALFTNNHHPSHGYNKYEFLDTRGFGDIRNDPNSDIVGSMMLEKAIQKSSKIKIICVNKFDSYSELITFQGLGDVLSKLLHGKKVPIYFLSTRSPYIQSDISDFYDYNQILKNEMKLSIGKICTQQEDICKDVIDKQKEIVYRQNNNNNETIQVFYNSENGKDLLEKDENVKKTKEQTQFVGYLKYSVDKGYYGYIDPMKKESIEIFFREIDQLSYIKEGQIDFHGYKQERNKLTLDLQRYTSIFLPLLKNINILISCDKSNLEKIISKFENEINENKILLADNTIPVNSPVLLEKITSGNNAYITHKRVIIDSIVQQISEKKKYISEYSSTKTYEIKESVFREWKFWGSWSPIQIFEYQAKIPYVGKPKITESNGTILGVIINGESPNYVRAFGSNSFCDVDADLYFTIMEKDRPVNVEKRKKYKEEKSQLLDKLIEHENELKDFEKISEKEKDEIDRKNREVDTKNREMKENEERERRKKEQKRDQLGSLIRTTEGYIMRVKDGIEKINIYNNEKEKLKGNFNVFADRIGKYLTGVRDPEINEFISLNKSMNEPHMTIEYDGTSFIQLTYRLVPVNLDDIKKKLKEIDFLK